MSISTLKTIFDKFYLKMNMFSIINNLTNAIQDCSKTLLENVLPTKLFLFLHLLAASIVCIQ